MPEYNQEKALEIQKIHGLSDTTLRVWKSRGSIPQKYFETEPRITLLDVMKDSEIDNPAFIKNIDTAQKKYGQEFQILLESRKFKPNQKSSYYSTCLMSLCKECKNYIKTGKLS